MSSTLLFYLGGHRPDLWRAVSRARETGRVHVVYSGGRTADDADVAALPPDVGRSAASDAVQDHRVACAREAAWRWVEDVGLRRPTALGPTLFELLRDEDGEPLWWISDITIQEKAYLVVRFVETLDHFLRTVQPTAVVVCGADREHPWQRRVFVEWARARKVNLVRESKRGDEGPDRAQERKAPPQARDDVPVAEGPDGRPGRPIDVASKISPAIPLDLALRVVELLLTPVAAIAGAVALVVVAAGSTTAPPTLVVSRSLRFTRNLLLVLLATVLGVVLFIPLAVALTVVGIILVLTAERADAVVDPRGIRAALARIDRRSLLARPVPIAAEQDVSASPPLILVVVDRGNERNRVEIGSRRRSSYNSYLEGVVTALRVSARNERIVVARYGSAPGGQFARGVRRLRRVLGSREVLVSDAITPAMWREATRWSRVDSETGKSITDRAGLGDVFEYEGVKVVDALRSDLETVFAILNERRVYVAAFRSLIARLGPRVIVTYNWEGVFRPLTEAAYRQGTTLFGVQQALGPYGHAIDHREAGYVRPGDKGDGFRIPNRLAVWGSVHEETLATYNLPWSVPVVTGYPRLDAFVNVHPDRAGLIQRLQIKDRDARLILYTPVLRVIGTPLVRESSYIRMFDDLVAITRSDPHVYVIVKPWGGDDISRLRQILWARGSRNIRFLWPDADIHNADLLAGSELLVGTFSSIVGEAVVAGCTPIMVNPTEARYYFGDEHIAHYAGLARAIEDPALVADAVLEELRRPPAERERIRAGALVRVEALFGPIDGKAADRVAAEVLKICTT